MRTWARATVVENVAVTADLHRVSLRVPAPVASAFHRPGQYHWVRPEPSAEAPFAIASAPGRDVFEYLVRRSGAAARAWTALGAGGTVDVSSPEGPGFPLHEARGRPLYLVGTGTGFAPLRAALQAVVDERAAFGPVRAVAGARTADELAWAHEWPALRAAGIELVATLSAPHEAWAGARGRVQQHLGPPLPAGAVAFLCGQAEMVRDVKARLAEVGVPADRVFLNT